MTQDKKNVKAKEGLEVSRLSSTENKGNGPKYPDWMYKRELPEECRTLTVDQDGIEFVLADAVVEALAKKIKDKKGWHISSTGNQICVFAPATKSNHRYGVRYLKFFIDVRCLHIVNEKIIRRIEKESANTETDGSLENE